MLEPLDEHDPAEAGPYRLSARIGSGGMGRVYLGRTVAGRALAIKIVHPELAADAEFRQRFRQEVAAARRVRGAFTAEVVDADVAGPMPWLATAYVPGPSLYQAVVERGPMPASLVWQLIAGVAEALQAIHAAGVVHRDLKPANVLLAEDGPRIIDFGIARATDTTSLTRTGFRVGSPQFMAPEHVAGQPVTKAADVFACGGLMVFAATGRTPFGSGPDAAVLYRVVNESPVLTGIDDARLRALAQRCLDKEPGKRPSPAEIIQEYVAISGSRPVAILGDWSNSRGEPARAGLPGPPAATSPRRAGRWPVPSWSSVPLLVLVIAAMASVFILDAGTRDHPSALGPPLGAGGGPTTVVSQPNTDGTAPTTTSTEQPTSQPPPVVTSTSGAKPAPAAFQPDAVQLTSPDFNGYCAAIGQGSAYLAGSNAYGWQCTQTQGSRIDLDAACRWTNNSTQAHASIADFYTADVSCWNVVRELGAADFTGYCRSLGYPGAVYNGQYAYGWGCANDPTAIRVDTACQWQFGSPNITALFTNFYDPDSWQCWG